VGRHISNLFLRAAIETGMGCQRADLARACGCAPSMLSDYASGRRPYRRIERRLARALRVSVEQLRKSVRLGERETVRQGPTADKWVSLRSLLARAGGRCKGCGRGAPAAEPQGPRFAAGVAYT
jgi:transcriptional regulator with XRE-family HTH domain